MYGLTQSLNVVRASSQRASRGDTYGLTSWQAFTIECWFQLDSLPTSGQVFSLGTIGWATIGAHLWIENNAGVYTIVGYRHAWGTNVTTISYTFTPVVGEWHHIAFTKDSSHNGELIYDGVSVATGALGSGTGTTQTINSVFGCGWNNGSFTHFSDGNISLGRIWSTNRSATQIADNMCNVFGTAETNMRAEYSFDNVYTDASGNGYTLTATNSPTFEATLPSLCSSSPTLLGSSMPSVSFSKKFSAHAY